MSTMTRRAALRRALLALACAPRLGFVLQPSYEEEIQRVVTSDTQRIALLDTWPDRATYRPGEQATLHIALVNHGKQERSVRLDARLQWLDAQVEAIEKEITLAPGSQTVSLPLALPGDSFRGYGVDLTLHDADGALLARGSTALDVLEAWHQAPRYGFLSDFAPDDPLAAAHVEALARYHINVVQFYDWMWRHYVLMPPEADFVDALGRSLSLRTVREKVAACRAHGMAALGYAAVYGAEPEYALAHRDQMLYDASGEPYSIEKLFYIMNIPRGNPWRPHILAEMARAVREVPFDGLHLDQYGFPKDQAFGPAPARTPYDLAEDFPPFI
ncbi:MAG TPA: glycoside hydrolase family 66 protein, partial [Chloroflexota bacterium]|nr:glycoside hydrolase family 66 protein [Chloroflexota bacterium]